MTKHREPLRNFEPRPVSHDAHGHERVGSSDPAVLLSFVGLIQADDLQKMSDAIAAGLRAEKLLTARNAKDAKKSRQGAYLLVDTVRKEC